MNRHADLALVRSAAEGSEADWQEIVHRAAPIIAAALRPRVHDAESRRDVTAIILDELKRGALAHYSGRSSFSTWLYLVARSRAIDHLRRQRGRRWSPPGFERLDPFGQHVFRLYFVEGLDLAEVLARVAHEDRRYSAEDVAGALRRIEDTLDPRVLRRLSYELQAESVGAASGRLLEYFDDQREVFRARRERLSPEHALLEKETRELHRRLQDHLTQLPEPQQRILRLRFEEGLKGREIAKVMGLASTRRAFTLLDRALQELRRRLSSPDRTPGEQFR